MPLAPIGAIAPAAPAAPAAPTAAASPLTAARSFASVLEAHASPRPSVTRPPSGPVTAAATRGLEALERAQARLDGLLAAARVGRTFTPQELLALQGDAYRFAQTVELSAKLVEQGAQAVRQALHAQV